MIRVALAANVDSAVISTDGEIDYVDHRGETKRLEEQKLRLELWEPGRIIARRSPPQFFVQVASFKNNEMANRLVAQLRRQYGNAANSRFDFQKRFYRVELGSFSSQQKAEELLRRVRSDGYRDARVNSNEAEAKRVERTSIAAIVSTETDPLISVGPVIIKPAAGSSSTLRFNNVAYRGQLQAFINRNGRLTLLNVLPLEEYVRGVVPVELSLRGFPNLEALKAQAIAARTYALYNIEQRRNNSYDLLSTAQAQVYGGLSAENELSNRAVEETRGLVATHDGEPINALYTSTCGGRTENNEFIFPGQPLEYLRSVECAPEKDLLASREIGGARALQAAIDKQGRQIARELALLSIAGFPFPKDPNTRYLSDKASIKEITAWAQRAVKLARREEPNIPRDQLDSLGPFASYISNALFGEGRAATLLSVTDAEYIIGKEESAHIPARFRQDVALLMQYGVLQPAPDGALRAGQSLSRSQVLQTIGRALFRLGIPKLETAIAQAPKADSLSLKLQSKEIKNVKFSKVLYLFRDIGGVLFPSSVATIVGDEKIVYHVNNDGLIDYLEVSPNPGGASSDRISPFSRWEVRLTRSQLQQQLLNNNIDVGELVDLIPVRFGVSRRVAELKIIGKQRRVTLEGFRIHSALGLRENLFVIDREYGKDGAIAAFHFTGRGWGHGVGMCQVGAYGLAQDGLNFEQILKRYYTGIKIAKVY